MMRLVTDEMDFPAPPLADAPVPVAASEDWPAEVDMILSAMDVGNRFDEDRRRTGRRRQRTRADLRLYANDPMSAPIALFTRDVTPRGLGFITKTPLPLGYNGLVRAQFGDTVLAAACSVYRCREAIGGWYEGALHFTTRQPDLD